MGIEFSPFKRVKTTTTYADGRVSSYESYAPNLSGFVGIMPMAIVVIFLFYILVAALKVAMVILLVLPFLVFVLHYKNRLKSLVYDENFHYLEEKTQKRVKSAERYNSLVSSLVTLYLLAVMVYMSVLVFTSVEENELNPFIIDALVNPIYYTVLLSSLGLTLYYITLAPFKVKSALIFLKEQNPSAVKFVLKRGVFQLLAFILTILALVTVFLNPSNLSTLLKEPLKYPLDQRENFRSLLNSAKFYLFSELDAQEIIKEAVPDNFFYTFRLPSVNSRNYLFHSYTLSVTPYSDIEECKAFKTILTASVYDDYTYLFDGRVPLVVMNETQPDTLYLEEMSLENRVVSGFYNINIVTIEHEGIGGHNEQILADFQISTYNWIGENNTICQGSAKVTPR